GIKELYKNPKDILKSVQATLDENISLQKQIEEINRERAKALASEWKDKTKEINGVRFLAERIDADAALVKDLAFAMKNSVENLFLVIGSAWEGKAFLTVMISENLVKEKELNASKIIRELSKEIQGGGGGQDFYATAGGKNIDGISTALAMAEKMI
ncbi:MAG: DHHA1 domain-containing protein, partial [Bacteroidota bacterium]